MAKKKEQFYVVDYETLKFQGCTVGYATIRPYKKSDKNDFHKHKLTTQLKKRVLKELRLDLKACDSIVKSHEKKLAVKKLSKKEREQIEKYLHVWDFFHGFLVVHIMHIETLK